MRKLYNNHRITSPEAKTKRGKRHAASLALGTLAFGLASLGFASCDNIDEAHRYIEEEAVEVARNVLLEEFTGQMCTNCPDGHRILQSLEEQYGENLIVVSIHAGNLSIPAPAGLKLSEGDEYAKYWDIYAYPTAIVDRTSGKLDYTQFADAVRKEIGKTTTLEMNLEVQLSDDKQNLEVFTTLVSPTPLNGTLQLWVVEDNITGVQIDNGKTIPDYVHNNVFRGCVNELWGVATPLVENEVKYANYATPVNPDWNLDYIGVVGFYYDASGVVQVEKVYLNPKP